MFSDKHNIITILGPTASGKTAFAAEAASMLNGEIISADSRQVYRGMNIGTGKDIDDYFVNGQKIIYHLVDIIDAGEKYNLFNFQQDFFKAFSNITIKNKTPIMCGGSGLYVDAVIRNYKMKNVPENVELRKQLAEKSIDELKVILSSYKNLHNKTDIDTKKRAIRAIEIEKYQLENQNYCSNYPKINSLNIGVKFDREIQKKRITKRLEQRLEEGMIDEVKTLLLNGIPYQNLVYYGLEYKYITFYVMKKLSYDEMFYKLNIAIHQFAKRQMTFFRRMEKHGVKIFWLPGQLTTREKLDKLTKIITS